MMKSRKVELQAPDQAGALEMLIQLLMKSADEYRLAQDMPIHRIHDLSTNLRGVRALRRLRNVKLRVESIQFERVMVKWTRRSARAHITSATQAYLACAIR